MRILTVADSDSYLKWVVALFAAAPTDWHVRHQVLVNVIEPSADQIAAAAPGVVVTRVSARQLARAIRRDPPDVLVLACTGPALEAVIETLNHPRTPWEDRPVLMTGLPGISFPPNDLAVHHRRAFDLLVLHSRREREAYAEVAAPIAPTLQIGLATLPFLPDRSAAELHRSAAPARDVVFAAQALVPPAEVSRRRILAALSAMPPAWHPVVKVRALTGEHQAHNEALPYATLWASGPQPRQIEFRAGPMAAALESAAGFVTVSSTAALEALAAGVPTLVLDDFGVSAEMINLVFEGSGLLGDLEDLAAARFREPAAGWLRNNYFHDAAENDWASRTEALVARRRAGQLSPLRHQVHPSRFSRARWHLRLLPQAQETRRKLARLAPRGKPHRAG